MNDDALITYERWEGSGWWRNWIIIKKIIIVGNSRIILSIN